MTRLLWLATFSLLALGAADPVAQQDQQNPVFRGTGDHVRVFVTVTDRDGRLVTDLPRERFEIRDEGRPQPITLFDNTPQPIRLIVMLDVSGSMHGNLPLLRASAEELFKRLGPGDLARVGTFGDAVAISPSFTDDLAALRDALPEAIPESAPTPLWRAIDEAIDAFGDGDGEIDARRVVLVLSDGRDSGPTMLRRRIVSQVEVIDRARDEDVMIYAIGLHSRGTQRLRGGSLQDMLTADLPDPGLARVAVESGGGYTEIRFGQDLGAAFAQVADELHAQYLLGFEPPRRDGRVHRIQVRVDQRGTTVRARREYVAPKSAP